jgi:tripartite-type tricarboxylate transporter receptor subunit TctC
VKKLAAEVNAIMGSPEIQARLASDGLAYTQMGPDQFAAFVKSETDKWTKIVRAAGVQMD